MRNVDFTSLQCYQLNSFTTFVGGEEFKIWSLFAIDLLLAPVTAGDSRPASQSTHIDYVTRCYLNLCLQQGSRDDRVSRDVVSFLYV